jgi:hypothetical protein
LWCRVPDSAFLTRLSDWYPQNSARFAFLTIGFVLVGYRILQAVSASLSSLSASNNTLDAPLALIRANASAVVSTAAANNAAQQQGNTTMGAAVVVPSQTSEMAVR